jgi:hypothetical protein
VYICSIKSQARHKPQQVQRALANIMVNFDIVVFDGTSYFVEDSYYELQEGESIVFRGSFKACSEKAERLNDDVYDKPRVEYQR